MTYDILLHLKTFSYDKVLFEKEKEAHEFLRHSSIWLHAKHTLVKYTSRSSKRLKWTSSTVHGLPALQALPNTPH
jgi:hypothetical protein